MSPPAVNLSLWRVLTRDFISIKIIIPAGVFVFIAFFYDFIPLDIFFIIVVIGAAAFSWRYGYYKKFFTSGQDILAIITYHSYKSSINWWGDDLKMYTCRIRYSYTVQDRTYEGKGVIKGGNSIFSDSRKLRKGDEISILVDPDNPQLSIIRNMYAPHAQTLLEHTPVNKPYKSHAGKRKKIKTDI